MSDRQRMSLTGWYCRTDIITLIVYVERVRYKSGDLEESAGLGSFQLGSVTYSQNKLPGIINRKSKSLILMCHQYTRA